MSNDFVPRAEAKFLSFATTFNAGIRAYGTRLGIPGKIADDNTAKLSAYTAAYHAARAPNAGKVDREDRREKREALTGSIRKIKRAYLDGDPLGVVTPEILLAFGLRAKDRIRTGVPDPAEVVPFSLEGGEYLQIVVNHPPRPPRYIGAVASYQVGGDPPASHKALTLTKLLTRPREILSFQDTDLGRTLYIALSWQNEKGRLGPPSPILSRVIA
jgi:hypothetical protein